MSRKRDWSRILHFHRCFSVIRRTFDYTQKTWKSSFHSYYYIFGSWTNDWKGSHFPKHNNFRFKTSVPHSVVIWMIKLLSNWIKSTFNQFQLYRNINIMQSFAVKTIGKIDMSWLRRLEWMPLTICSYHMQLILTWNDVNWLNVHAELVFPLKSKL